MNDVNLFRIFTNLINAKSYSKVETEGVLYVIFLIVQQLLETPGIK